MSARQNNALPMTYLDEPDESGFFRSVAELIRSGRRLLEKQVNTAGKSKAIRLAPERLNLLTSCKGI